MASDQPRRSLLAPALDEVVLLVRDTWVVFVRLFPQITAVFLVGFVGDAALTQLAAVAADRNGWAGVVVFSMSFLFDLVAVVVILRLCGQELGIRDLIPSDERVEDDGRDSSVTRLVSVTLLPFLGLYAAFGLVEDKAGQLVNQGVLRGQLAGGPSVLSSVRGLATAHPWGMGALLVGLYVLRRLVDLVHERSGVRVLGFGAAVVESFFILVVIFGGFVLLQRPVTWLTSRAYVDWLRAVGRGVEHALAALDVHLPALLHRFGDFLSGTVGPLFLTVVSQPIIWLAVAALVYGSQVLSLAELWRRGRPAASRVVGGSVFDRRRDRRALRLVAPRGVVRLGGELKEALFGDLDDKYLPAFHSLRLVLRAGFTFLGAFVLVYTVVLALQGYVQQAYLAVIGAQHVQWWVRAAPLLDVVDQYPWEPLRLCLLAVAFRRCLELFARRAGGGAALRPAAGAAPSTAVADAPAPAEAVVAR